MNRVTGFSYSSEELVEFRERLLSYISSFDTAVLLDSNTVHKAPIPVTGIKYDLIGGAGVADEASSETHSLEELQHFIDTCRAKQNLVFGYFSYDLKNEFEKLTSSNPDYTQFPNWHFFVPAIQFTANNGRLEIRSNDRSAEEILKLIQDSKPLKDSGTAGKIIYKPGKDQYLNTISEILHHIQCGNIYEMNYCDEIRVEGCTLNPAAVFKKLTDISPNPFSAYYRYRQHAVACTSPERFIMKQGSRIYSQPMKGTMPRSYDVAQDATNREILMNSLKERSENVMITDLVRNDLSRISTKASVRVDDLFGVYAFKKSHQMITTVSGEIKDETRFTDIIKALFPMGSMTGAPKISAMQLIEQYEKFRRGLFSGTIGYLSNNGDFDFNVVIRSIFFNTLFQRASIAAGGAITIASDPAQEYDEMLLKLRPQMEVIGD